MRGRDLDPTDGRYYIAALHQINFKSGFDI